MTEYVAGFLFDERLEHVALVRKLKPEWQKDKLNGIGGKVEPGEDIHSAMVREFQEETGVTINTWKHEVVLKGNDWTVYFFSAIDDKIFDVATVEDEEILIVDIDSIWTRSDLMRNLRTLISLALDYSGIVKPVLMEDYS